MNSDVLICGGGLAGLAAGHALARAGADLAVLERAARVGGLARTVEYRGQRFDLGGHRLLTDSERVRRLVGEVVREPLLAVPRASKILLGGRCVDYPLRLPHALAGLGPAATLRIARGWLGAQLAHRLRRRAVTSLEDWVVRHYGRPLFELFFRPYSEKVWGLDCARISADWVAQRIQGLTLGMAVRQALAARPAPGRLRTLRADFLYPARGIGAIADGLRAGIELRGRVRTEVAVTRIVHRGGRIEHAVVRAQGASASWRAREYLSSLPLPALVSSLWPAPPAGVVAAAARLRYRDLILVAVRVGRERVTDQTWIYVPAREVSFGRVHEPKNWSAQMGASGETLLVTEHFCDRRDAAWQSPDAALIERSADDLAAIGLVRRADALDGLVVRVPNAYPLFEVGYVEACETVKRYLAGFANLHLIGRTGAFRYFNMDHAIESGLDAGAAVLERLGAPREARRRAGAVA
ncbi:MAG: FAD-dependent oxidoreductase [Betaproteobacteria bacterium]|nr:FAD-dependent oxidoreductase [Betaproteobacteria bacterium]